MRYLGEFGTKTPLIVCRSGPLRSIFWLTLTAPQISMAEAGGAEGRGSYYESTGVVRDVMQNRESALTKQRSAMYLRRVKT